MEKVKLLELPYVNEQCKLVEFYGHNGNTGCRVFKGGVQKLERFLPKNNIPKGNYCIFKNLGGVKKCQNLTFKVNFLCQKNIFFIEEYQFRSRFFKSTLLLK